MNRERIRSFFSDEGGFIASASLINSFTMIWKMYKTRAEWIGPAFQYLSTVFLLTLAASLLLRLIPSARWRLFAKRALLFLCFVPFVAEVFVMYYYDALLGAGVVSAILGTNVKEAVEFFRMYVTLWDALGVLAVAIFAFYLISRRPWQKIHVAEPWGSTIPTLLTAVASVTVAVATIGYEAYFLEDLLPIRAGRSFATSIENVLAYRKLAEEVPADVDVTDAGAGIGNLVFILGESTNRNHMHLYGYYIENTPRLDALYEKGEIAVFRDVVAPYSTTIAVLSEMMTFSDRETDTPWHERHTLIDVMRSSGYRTMWLSNQESSGIWGNVAQLYADRSDFHRFTHLRDSHEDEGIVDGDLLPILDEAMTRRAAGRNFIVLHLMGGHGLYYNRYPYSFHRFTADDIRLAVSERFRTLVAEYDNALYYNDHVVAEIIERFRYEEALVIYLPDHGEAVYDEGGSVAGHIEENPSRHMIEVPLIFWASEKFLQKYPNVWEKIRGATDRPYMTDDMIHTVLDIAGIVTPEYRPEKSVINDGFDDTRRRIVFQAGEDYDREIRP